MTHTTYQQTRDQVAHFVAALFPILFFIFLPTVAAFAALGFYLGIIREVSQHDSFDLTSFGRGSWLDISFWTLGGLTGGLLVA